MTEEAVVEKKTKKTEEKNDKTTAVSDTNRLQNDESSESQLVTFFLDKIEFSIDINKVKEIVRIPEIIKIPNAPAYVDGIANLRGTVLPIINTRIRYGMNRTACTEQSRILVIDTNGVLTGMIVDSVKEVLRINNNLIEPAPPVVKGVNSEFLQGVIKLNQGKRLIITIDVAKTCMTHFDKISKSAASEASSSINQSKTQKTIEEHIEEELLVTFKLENEEFAFSIANVNEIIRVPNITMVPNSPAYVRGVISLRNEILPIVDLRSFLDIKLNEYSDATRIMVVDILNSKIGLVVDKVSEVLKINKKSIESPPIILSKQEQRQLRGLAKLNEGKRLIMLFDSDGLFEQGEISTMDEIVKTKGGGKNAGAHSDLGRTDMDVEQLVSFKLSNEEFGVKITQVQEINRLESITKVPNSPSFIEGVSNLRGNVIPVISLRKRFSMDNKESDDKTRLIIVDIQGNKTGLIVDSVSEVLRMPKKNIEITPPVISSSVDAEFMAGIGKLNDGKRMVILLNLQRLLSDTETKELESVKQKDKAAKN